MWSEFKNDDICDVMSRDVTTTSQTLNCKFLILRI